MKGKPFSVSESGKRDDDDVILPAGWARAIGGRGRKGHFHESW